MRRVTVSQDQRPVLRRTCRENENLPKKSMAYSLRVEVSGYFLRVSGPLLLIFSRGRELLDFDVAKFDEGLRVGKF